MLLLLLAGPAVAWALQGNATGWQADQEGFTRTAAPFFQRHCVRCHGPDKAKGEFRIDKHLPNDFRDPAAQAKWKEVVNMLNSHEMPPKKEKQPTAAEVAQVVDWITTQLARDDLAGRDRAVVLRRLNREEYRNTIRDLTGVEFDTGGFPQDPPAGGFDNNGKALSFSPLLMELYLNAARQILDRALVEGSKPPAIRWRFDPKPGDADARRIKVGTNNAIINGGRNQTEKGFVIVRNTAWDRGVNARDFKVPVAGTYVIRLHAAGKVPTREQVVTAAGKILQQRIAEQAKQDPKAAEWHRKQYETDLKHFQTEPMYDYGPPRVKLVQHLGSQPRTVAEFDVDGTPEQPKVYEFRARFTTESAGVNFEYAYSIPSVLENFWLQNKEEFPRPELLIDWFEIEGPVFPGTAWPPPSHAGILIDSPLKSTDERGYAREVLSRFLRRAYRRPVAAAEVDAKLALFDRARKDRSFVEAIKLPLTAILASPHFLYLTEPTADDQPRPLTDHELAARLAYFLWSAPPDDELGQLADAGKLRDPATLKAQANRLLADPRSEAFVRNFAGQWLGLREVGANPPAPDLYPQYDRHLELSIVGESEAFFREILQNDLSARNFLKSDFVVINERLARFYGIPGVRGDQFRRVPVPPNVRRGGIATQAAILTITSNGTRTSPVKRGVWILKNLLGTDPGLPVANAGEIAPKVPGIDKATVRKRLEVHRQLEQCARCHAKIDPLGFALENYNAAGEWRDREGFGYKGRVEPNDPPIDASAQMPDGTKIVGVAGLQTALLKNEDLFLGCLASKMLAYSLGREVGLADQPTVKAAVAHLKKNKHTVRSLVEFIVTAEAFGAK